MKTIVPQIRRAAPALLPVGRVSDAPPSVDLRIGALVFHGFSHADSHRAATAFQTELTRLITAHGLPEFAGKPPDFIDAGSIRAAANRPELTGTRAARTILGGLRV